MIARDSPGVRTWAVVVGASSVRACWNWVAASVLVILLTGGFLLMQFGGGHATWPLHAMAGLGIVMMLIFGHIRFAVFPRIRRAVPRWRSPAWRSWPGSW